MLFAHLKRILKLDRLRLRGHSGAHDEFLLAATEQIDVAVVDINISGQVATAVADRLIDREIPFLFVSGYEKMRGTRYASIPLLRKPFEHEDLHNAVERVLRG